MPTKTRRPGRPKLDDKRNKVIGLRVTADEHASIARAAANVRPGLIGRYF